MFRSFFRPTRKQASEEINLISDHDLDRPDAEALTPSDVAADNDLSYDDALLDLEMRAFFRHEYSLAEPQANVYGRVLHSINAGQISPQAAVPVPVAVPGWLTRVSRSFSRIMTTSASARLVPGAVALLLVIGVLG